LHTEVRELIGETGALEGVVVEDIDDGSRFTLSGREVRVFIGRSVHSMARRDAHPRLGRLRADRLDAVPPGLGARRGPVPPPGLLETNVPGVFAADAVRSGSVKRVASAVGEGAMAIAWCTSTWRRCGSGEVMAWPVRRAFRSSSGSSARQRS
jgi:thioredoxin reductase (NADPH)